MIELAPARTLTSILEEVDAPIGVKFLSVDVEGGELEVLKGISFSKFSVEWILVETHARDLFTDFLGGKGYGYHSQLTPHDYLSKLRH